MYKDFEEAFASRKLRLLYVNDAEKKASLTLNDVDEKVSQEAIDRVVTGIAHLMRNDVKQYNLITTNLGTEKPVPAGVDK